ncbi:LacI family DNA-binding transcriptional regulator [Nonomuraea spiralis]|uniref:LacI family DNA-binding transcriptional regulator n=1 Tax=Nonomuraea spiralis TaxID=46182 RepID=A0ABV5IDW1_9ACTN|nr:LacI family DNA-binding transcriptional regulator [Nonomuraea spiralis]GGT30839.1 hypothetical protein GCM10010176_089350 [Nonomuraea spiralis]
MIDHFVVARRAGVSHQTVSRYFRKNETLRPATRSKIDLVVQELNYRPNLVARSMRTRHTNRLAVTLPASDHLWPARMLEPPRGRRAPRTPGAGRSLS